MSKCWDGNLRGAPRLKPPSWLPNSTYLHSDSSNTKDVAGQSANNLHDQIVIGETTIPKEQSQPKI